MNHKVNIGFMCMLLLNTHSISKGIDHKVNQEVVYVFSNCIKFVSH